jgi:hypothetical protein
MSKMDMPVGIAINELRSDGTVTVTAEFMEGRMAAPFARVFDALRKLGGNQEAYSILADTERALKRAAKRAESLSGEWERVEFLPTRGATVEFTGRLLVEDEFESRGPTPIAAHMQIWETKGGALVAVDETQRIGTDSTPRLAVLMAPPIADVQEQRFAVMEHFGWSSRARSMARKLGWSLRVEVE